MPSQVALQVERGDCGFGQATQWYMAQLTDNISDDDILCSGVRASELFKSTVCFTSHTSAEQGAPMASWKEKPKIAPKPVMGAKQLGKNSKSLNVAITTKSATRVLFKECANSSMDSDDVFWMTSNNKSLSPKSESVTMDKQIISKLCTTHGMVDPDKGTNTGTLKRVTRSTSGLFTLVIQRSECLMQTFKG